MVFFIDNCFHWIGFHIVNDLLENGYRVDGADDIDTDKKEHMSMFVGRNQSFRHVTAPRRDTEYDAMLSVHDHVLRLEMNRQVTIKLPLVFGEWMPMTKEGMYMQNDFIRFDSEQFALKAVYIANVLKSLEQWIHSSALPPVLEVKSCQDRGTENVTLENAVYIRNNGPINERISLVKNHYERYKKFI